MHFLQAINSDLSVLIVCNKTGGTIKGDKKKTAKVTCSGKEIVKCVCCGVNITASLVKFCITIGNTFSQLDGNLMGVSFMVPALWVPFEE